MACKTTFIKDIDMTKNIPLSDSAQLIELGYIHFAFVGRPHGLKGGFFLKTEDRRTAWPGYSHVLVETAQGFSEKQVERHYLSGNALALELESLTRTDLEALYNKKIFVHKSKITLQENEFLVHDLMNFQVRIPNKSIIGKICGVISYGAQENLEIELNSTFKSQNPSAHERVLFPFIDKYVHVVDYENKQIEIEYIEEFLIG